MICKSLPAYLPRSYTRSLPDRFSIESSFEQSHSQVHCCLGDVADFFFFNCACACCVGMKEFDGEKDLNKSKLSLQSHLPDALLQLFKSSLDCPSRCHSKNLKALDCRDRVPLLLCRQSCIGSG